MSFFSTQNPGIDGLDEITVAEGLFLGNIANLAYVTGDILYYDGTAINRLPIGSAGRVLTVSSGLPSWQPASGGVTDGDKGDITVSGSGATWTIDNGVVTFAKMQSITDVRIIGRSAGSAGAPQEISIGSGLSLSAGTLSATGAGVTDGDKGDITVSGSGATWTIDAQAVTYAKIQNVTDARILGRSAGSAGSVQEITIGTGLTLSAGTLSATGTGVTDGDKGDITVSSSGTVWTIDNQAVTRNKLEHIQSNHFLGRHAAGTGDVQEVSPAQATAILNVFDSSNKGLAPASGGGTSNFLRADGTWAVPPSGSGGIVRSIVTTSSSITAGSSTATDYQYIVPANHTITLPTAVGNSNLYGIKNMHTASINVQTTSSQTIDGFSAPYPIYPYENISFISDGSNWVRV